MFLMIFFLPDAIDRSVGRYDVPVARTRGGVGRRGKFCGARAERGVQRLAIQLALPAGA